MLWICIILDVFLTTYVDTKKEFSRVKLSQFLGKFDILPTDFCTIMSNFVATDVYALFNIHVEKFAT